MVAEENIVKSFKEKKKSTSINNMINGGFFVFKKKFLDTIPNDSSCDLEKLPLEKLTMDKELSVYKHTDFWQCMDTYRDYLLLNKLWNENPNWKLWKT